MKRLTMFVIGILFCAGFAFAAEKTWSGKISDSMCGRSHKASMEHSGKKMSDHDCVIACVKGGGKYVFVAGGKIYNIENQDFAGLEEHAAHNIRLTGERTGDNIKVTKIAMARKVKSKKAA